MSAEAKGECEALKIARATVTKAKLRFPKVPAELQGVFFKYRNWCWGSLETPIADPYEYDLWGRRILEEHTDFGRRVRRRGLGNLVMLGQGGHGENAMALTWVLVRRPLEIVLQLTQGDDRTDPAAARKAWDHAIAACDELLDLVEAGDPSPTRPLGREFDRFVLCGSDFYGAGKLEDFGELAPYDPSAPPAPPLPPSTSLGPRVFIGNPKIVIPAALERARACRKAGKNPAAP
ncbi:MAG: hypothetical protein FD180_392 [Planctomycetota bacterium]|nr:MAG: hypothetical protein FD180_392 [Planctomycetota bacterium]